MLNLESRMEILGITVFQDADNPDQYYYLPGPPRITREDGEPLFDLFSYRRGGAAGTELAGGFLNMTVDLNIGDRRRQVEQRLRRQSGREVVLAPVPFTRGRVRAIALGEEGGGNTGDAAAEDHPEGRPRFIERILGSGMPSLDGDNRAILSFSLNEEGVALLMGALSDAPDARPVGIVYELDYVGLLPAYDLEITIDFEMVADYMHDRFTIGTTFFSADVDTIIEELRRNEAISIRETARTLELSTPEAVHQRQDRIDKLVAQLVTHALFTPTLTPRAPAAGAEDRTGRDSTTGTGSTPRDGGDAGGSSEGGRPPSDPNPGTGDDSGGRPDTREGNEEDAPDEEGSSRRPGSGGRQPSDSDSDAEEDSGRRPDTREEEDDDTPDAGGDSEERDSQSRRPSDSDSDTEEDSTGRPDTREEDEEDTTDKGGSSQRPGTVSEPTVQLAYVHKAIRQEERRSVTYNLTQAMAQENTVAPQGFIRLLADPEELRQRVHVVDLDHPFFQRININVNARSVDFDAEGIVGMLVQLRYGVRSDGTGPKDTAEVILRSPEDGQDFTFFADHQHSQSYEYRLVADYRSDFGMGVRDTRVAGPWTETEARSLSVHPSWLQRTLPVTVQLAPNLPADVAEVHVRLRYRCPSRDIDDSRLVRLSPKERSQVVHIRLADEREEYEVTTVLFYADGTREELPVLRLPDESGAAANQTIVVSADRSDHLDGDVIMLDPLGELQRVLADVQVHQADSLVYSNTFDLESAGARATWSVRLIQDDEPVQVRYRERRLYQDGGFEEDDDWRIAISRSLIVGIPAEGVSSVSVNYIGPELAAQGISALVVDLAYRDPDGDPRFDQGTSLLITDDPDTHIQDWRIRRASRDASTYRWRVTQYYSDGREFSSEFRDDTRPLLLVQPAEGE